jgi:hypothetical protein
MAPDMAPVLRAGDGEPEAATLPGLMAAVPVERGSPAGIILATPSR